MAGESHIRRFRGQPPLSGLQFSRSTKANQPRTTVELCGLNLRVIEINADRPASKQEAVK